MASRQSSNQIEKRVALIFEDKTFSKDFCIRALSSVKLLVVGPACDPVFLLGVNDQKALIYLVLFLLTYPHSLIFLQSVEMGSALKKSTNFATGDPERLKNLSRPL